MEGECSQVNVAVVGECELGAAQGMEQGHDLAWWQGGSVHGGDKTGHRTRVGRALCKTLLPQKELPHTAVIAVKYSGISVSY